MKMSRRPTRTVRSVRGTSTAALTATSPSVSDEIISHDEMLCQVFLMRSSGMIHVMTTEPTTAPTRVDKRRERTRGALISAAQDFLAQGQPNVSIQQITD